MELWIRSQDKRILQKVDNVYLNANYENKRICTNDSRDYESDLGEYETEERAIEVLDEIHRLLINLQCLEVAPDVYKIIKGNLNCVYEMPQE